jgi:hypothetical protein
MYDSADTTKWLITAYSRSTFIGCPIAAMDSWVMDGCGRICHEGILDPNDCTVTYNVSCMIPNVYVGCQY